MGDWAPAERVRVRDVDVFLWRLPERVPLR